MLIIEIIWSNAKCFVYDSNDNDIDLSRIIDFDDATNLFLKTSIFMRGS
jgi:hypothetical protein